MIAIIIPAYRPESNLVVLVAQLTQCGFPVIVIDDGSGTNYRSIFEKITAIAQTTVLSHQTNLGKGAALKTAFHYFLDNYPNDSVGVITADADGQHLLKDIKRITECLAQNSEILWLGTRQFDDRKIPWKSRFGNELTRTIFKWFTGSSLQDTQTGLRGIPVNCLPLLTQLTTSAYDFELDMLLRLAKQNITLRELPITTVYIENNISSHFNPLIDSLKIYYVFLRYLFTKLHFH